jgi:hypothetical protein
VEKLYEALFGEGGILRVRAALAFALTGACIYLFVDDKAVPDSLLALTSLADGFYFGTRSSTPSAPSV